MIAISQDDRIALQHLLHDGHTEQRVARRARVLLAMTNPEIVVQQLADQVLLTRAAIWALCRRYEQIGI
ncbi:MAG TPA: helix-turn-helix domain-containing protein, partial [Blastocatellia bacterium]|nr:helix-turn-helix domain-containing protein [Blastocatellia bacterium]